MDFEILAHSPKIQSFNQKWIVTRINTPWSINHDRSQLYYRTIELYVLFAFNVIVKIFNFHFPLKETRKNGKS